jgi:UDP-glucose 4-epimerase
VNLPLTPETWIVGAGGMAGSATAGIVGKSFCGQSYPWGSDIGVAKAIREDAQRFVRAIGDREWRVFWLAGRGVVGASKADLNSERHALESVIEGLQSACPERRGVLVFASSAGAVYAGSDTSPRTEATEPVSQSAYGDAKLEQESLLRDISGQGVFAKSVIARIANVYGPGQDTRKSQGLITHLCRAVVTRGIVNLYVPIDTRRHYIDADDAAAQLVACSKRARVEGPGEAVVKIISSGPSVTVGELVATVHRVARRPVRVARGLDERAALQPTDLRLRSDIWVDIGKEQGISLAVGIDRVLRSVERSFAVGGVALRSRK